MIVIPNLQCYHHIKFQKPHVIEPGWYYLWQRINKDEYGKALLWYEVHIKFHNYQPSS